MFIDETEIEVSSGRGGHGMSSFRREKYIPRGGPDGGDGGHGGNVILRAVIHLNTLGGLQHKRKYSADNGGGGGTALKSGKRGDDLVLEVPVGTLVKDAQRGHVLKDLAVADDEVVVVQGGVGGKGNKHFAHATNQAPRRTTEGQPGETRRLKLELRLVADVGLVGLPNAGKSTFLSRVSRANPKIADYPFTTLRPMLGMVESGYDDGMVIADIPGLIEGAHEGAGLGDRFLRHIQRTRILLHLVDAGVGAEQAALDWRTIRGELEASGHGLDDRPHVVAVSKIDVAADAAEVASALESAGAGTVSSFSSATGTGLPELLGRLRQMLAELAEGGGKPQASGPSNA
ncbi:MAG: GTPase Obg [Planctomycetota bacterium]|nr:MAG: GTPase Obg [Planctomycetota bacterium]